jgi:hypothetical protein
MRALRTALVAATALLLLGCGGGDDAPAKTTAAKAKPKRPVLCGRLRGTVTGHVSAPDAKELSGLALSRLQANVLWTHNDSGDTARVFAIDTAGKLLAQLTVPGAEAVDWEDIAVGPRGDLYLADIGDNLAKRPSVVVYRVPEPKVTGSAGAAQTGPATRYELRYPDGARDAEALLVDPRTGALTIVSKSFGGTAGIYTAASPSATAPTTLTKAGTLSLGIGEAVTAGDVAADGRTVALRTYDRAFVWSKTAKASVPATLRRRSCSPSISLLDEGQGEALALSRHGTSFLTVPEGANPALRRYAPAR